MPTISEKRCDTCQYFAGQPDQDGECRRHAPINSKRPARVRPEYWCGDWRSAVEVPKIAESKSDDSKENE